MCSQCKMLIYEGEILEITSNSVLEDGGGGGGGGIYGITCVLLYSITGRIIGRYHGWISYNCCDIYITI